MAAVAGERPNTDCDDGIRSGSVVVGNDLADGGESERPPSRPWSRRRHSAG